MVRHAISVLLVAACPYYERCIMHDDDMTVSETLETLQDQQRHLIKTYHDAVKAYLNIKDSETSRVMFDGAHAAYVKARNMLDKAHKSGDMDKCAKIMASLMELMGMCCALNAITIELYAEENNE